MFRIGRWEYAHREQASGAIAIVAITPDRKLILVEQFRPPVRANTIELPAGLVGDLPGDAEESVIVAARRELLEETGYEAGQIEVACVSPSSPGLTSETITLLIARELRRTGAGGGVEHENIIVHEVPMRQVSRFLNKQAASGKPVDFKVYAGLYFAARKKA